MPRYNAEASFSSLGMTLHMTVDISNLNKESQILLLHQLMQSTGTTAAIHKTASKKTFDEIDEAWAAFKRAT